MGGPLLTSPSQEPHAALYLRAFISMTSPKTLSGTLKTIPYLVSSPDIQNWFTHPQEFWDEALRIISDWQMQAPNTPPS
jgi:hypothetical protein